MSHAAIMLVVLIGMFVTMVWLEFKTYKKRVEELKREAANEKAKRVANEIKHIPLDQLVDRANDRFGNSKQDEP